MIEATSPAAPTRHLSEVRNDLDEAALLLRALVFATEVVSHDLSVPLITLIHVIDDRVRDVSASLDQLAEAERRRTGVTVTAA